ncbi:GLUG motif-containing protein [Cyclobacterium sp. SYSU L10401]|uniref:GLUG motif-containing protein n=1 Tax=Cyclobacterium sp. SYSU L10401 TaxID=2678657 RepID=UPI0013D22097|nr:GLUG motif-containing protein [Cyclobacterium sp. SYSU L10401]
MAGPSGGMVVDGAADIVGQGSNAVTVNQHSNRAVINWQSFDTQSHQRVEFVQPDVNSIVLNRIISGSPTQFDGSLTANGRVVVMNPNGVVFGQSAQVDVGGLIATSSHVSTDSFMNDAQIRFEAGGDPAGSIVNHGTITVRDAGLVGFVAPHVENKGTITARMGTVHLASGDRFTFDLYGDGLVEIAASDAINAQLVKNSGTIKADGGVVQLEAASAKTMVDGLVSNTGVIEAKSVHEKNGVIILSGDQGTTSVSGTVDASGKGASETGGRIEVTGKAINLASARIDASGSEDGGTIRIGGGYQGGEDIPQADTTTVDAETTITADAITNGDGGSIVVWSNELTDISATLSAKGGLQSGDGGMIETSSKGRATFQDAISIDTSAPNGETGLWYIDPEDFTIADVGGDITPVVLSGQLGSNNVTIETADTGSDAGDIVVEDALSWGSDRTLILNAHRDIDINASINNTTGGSLVLRSDKAGSGAGTVSFNGSGSVTMTGGGRTDIYYNPSAYDTPTDYSTNITGDSTAWMLVHDVTQLQAINTNNTTRAGSYALSGDIDASDTVNWNSGAGFVPIGDSLNNFTGQFDGQNHIISELYINRPTENGVGLFGYTSGATIRNVGLVNVDITGNDHVGGLVGENRGGIIYDSYSIGDIMGLNSWVGGLVGLNRDNSTISRSFADGNVLGLGSRIGGLVGANYRDSTISNSYAIGIVEGNSSRVGGLVGYNNNSSTVNQSYATGPITGTSDVGGLVGRNASDSTVTNSYWDMDTSGQATSAGGSGAVGLTSAQARQQASYGGWNFADDWYMIEDETRPFGRWEYSTNIGNAHQLQLMAMDLNADYTLVRNIELGDALDPVGGDYTGMWTDSGFVPIGNSSNNFTGVFDGQNNVITDLTINRPGTNNNVGLFGVANNAIITRLGLENIEVIGRWDVGALIGTSRNNTELSYSYAIGNVYGATRRHGGLVGVNIGSIIYSYADVNVTGGEREVGGLVGDNIGTISHSYATGNVSGTYGSTGGLVGRNRDLGGGFFGEVHYSWSSGNVSVSSGGGGGLIGTNSGGATVTNSYWDMDTSGQATSAGGAGVVGLTSAQARQQASYVGWDFTNDWYMIENETRPFGGWEYSTNIGNAHQLQLMVMDLGADYTLVRDIDLGDALAPVGGDYTGMWTDSGFVPIGNSSNNFTGEFDGQNHVITDLTINRPSTNNIGLFGYTTGSLIHNVGLVDIDITGFNDVSGLVGTHQNGSTTSNSYATGVVTGRAVVGGLVGLNRSSSISESYFTGDVSGSNSRIGGLVGRNIIGGTISESYATGTVTGIEWIGGLVGLNGANSTINESYATSDVTGSDIVGGLVGYNNNSSTINESYSSGAVSGGGNVGGLIGLNNDSTITDSYWNVETSGQATSAGGAGAIGLTTAEMQEMDSFAGWDIDDVGGTDSVWRIYEGQTSPLLRHFMTPLTVTANNDSTLYDGIAYTGGNGVVWSGFKDGDDVNDLSGVLSYGGTAQNVVNAGNYGITPMGVYSGQQGYDITTQSGALTITPRDITVTADAVSRVYGDANPALNYTVGGDGLVSGDTLSGSLATTATVTSDIGNYAITQGDLNNANYTITSYTGNDLTITTRDLVIRAQDKTKIKGQANPVLTYAIGGDGLANGDTPLSGSLTTVALISSEIGSYAITQGSVALSDTNYTMAFVPGSFSIVPVPDMPASIEAGRYNALPSPVVPLQQYSPGNSSGSSSSGIGTDGPMYNVDILNGGINLDNNSFDLNLISPSASGDTDTVTNQTSNAYTIYFTKPLLQQLGYLK